MVGIDDDHVHQESGRAETRVPCQIAPDDPVVQFLAAVILDGWRTADLTVDFLARPNGKRAKAPESPPPPVSLESEFPDNPSHDLLRDLGAALRIAEWERAGLKEHLPAELPTAAESLCRVFQGREGSVQYIPGSIAEKQFEAWLGHFALHAYETLGRDVLVDDGRVDVDSFLECLAAFLLDSIT